MSEVIVSKFGGTSNANAEVVERCLEQGADSLIMVVSAPGILTDQQLDGMQVPAGVSDEFFKSKVTKQGMAAHELASKGRPISEHISNSIRGRFESIVHELDLNDLKGEWLRDIGARVVAAAKSYDHAYTLGEVLVSEVYQAAGRELLDPLTAGRPLLPRRPDMWRDWASTRVDKSGRYVTPGNIWFDGKNLRSFSTGGSDTTGGIMSYAVNASRYINSTDTPAKSVDPEIISDEDRQQIIEKLSYIEGRDLGRSGTGLLHPEAIVPLMGTGIPTEIRNTFDPDGLFTLYTDGPSESDDDRKGKVMAISLVQDVAVLKVLEPGMSEEEGRIVDLARPVAEAGISVHEIEGYGSDQERFFVSGEHELAVINAIGRSLNKRGTVVPATGRAAMITLVGNKIGEERYTDIICELARLGVGRSGGVYGKTHWLQGEHSVRFTIENQDAAKRLVDEAHAALIEKNF